MSDEFFRRSLMDLEDLGDGEADRFRDDDAYAPEPAAAPERQWAPDEGPLRVVPASEASALLRIKLPDSPPVPATTLRADAPPLERVHDAATMFATRTNPSRPNALPGDVMALTTATMVVPVPAALAHGGAARAGQRTARLTASVPPDLASRAEADLLSDTVEQFFGDFDAIGRELAAGRAGQASAAGAPGVVDGVARPATVPGGLDPAGTGPGTAAPHVPHQPGDEYGSGRYGVPTQFPGYDAARRSPVGMRYLGGIFHDSSGESSFYDPQTAALVPLASAGTARAAADFRRPAPVSAATQPAGAPRVVGPSVLRSAPPPRRPAPAESLARSAAAGRASGFGPGLGSDAPDLLDEPEAAEHWEHHHPDHHRTKRTARRRRTRVMLVSAVVSVLAFGGLYGVALAMEGQVPKGTMVDGVAIGGMSRAAAEAKLAEALGPGLMAPIRLTADGTTLTLDPAQAGLKADWTATVAAASDGREDPFVAIPALGDTRRTFALRTSIDRQALRAALAKATASFDKPLIEGGVTFPGGVPTPVAPKPGRAVDVDSAVANVAAAFENGAAALGPTQSSAAAGGSGGATIDGDRIAPVALGVAANQRAVTPSATPTAVPAGDAATPVAPGTPAAPAPATPATPKTSPAAPADISPGAGGPSVIPPVTLTVQTLLPTVTPAEVAQLMQDFARPAMSGPVTLVTGSLRSTLKPAVFGKYLSVVPDGHGHLVPKLDGAGLRTELDQAALAKLEQPAANAGFTVTDGKPVLVPGKPGTGYAPQAIGDAVVTVLAKPQASQRTATVVSGPLPPTLTTEAAQALGVRDVMGTYTASFSAASQRTANVRRAADLLRGQVVQPGGTFSLNQALGARTAANGYVPADTADRTGGQDAGAGASLVATALFNAEYQSGLKDVEHHPHASLTDRFPAGLEAATAYPDVDLKFQNDSASPVYLWTAATDATVTVAVLGQKDYSSVQTEMSPHYAVVQPKTVTGSSGSCTTADGVAGFQIDVTRILARDGQDPVRQVFHTAYAAQDKVVCPPPASSGSANGPGPSPTGTPGTSPAPTSAGATGTPTSAGSTSGPGGTGYPGSGTPAPTSPTSSWDGTLLGGLLGAPQQPKR